jgi:septum formation protein
MGSNVEESSGKLNPHDYAVEIAFQKAEAIWEKLKGDKGFGKSFFPFIIASDTVVELEGKFYGKPSDRDDARAMLRELSGKEHRVVTSIVFKAFCLASLQEKEHSFSVETHVLFSKITEDIMEPYLVSGESLDKAGSYGIQGKGLLFVKSLRGSYSNVVGFPLEEFLNHLKDFLLPVDEQSSWRSCFHL